MAGTLNLRPGVALSAAQAALLNSDIVVLEAADSWLVIADRVAAAGMAPLPTEEITAEVKAVCKARKERASGH